MSYVINFIIGWCLNNRFLVFLATIAVTAVGWYCFRHTPVDAIPDIGEKQVIVYADWPGRDPKVIEDQVTFPLTVGLQGTPGVKSIRSMSGFGFTMVFVVFQALQDWYVRYQLQSVEGVSEVASLGGFVKQYQIDVDPDKMRAHRVTLMDVHEAVRKSNIDVGAKVVEQNGLEFFIRGAGFVKSVADVENIVIRQEVGTPIFVKNVATVQLGPDFRRGALDNAGKEAVGGVVLMRYGVNPLEVINRVKERIKEIEPGLKISLADGRQVPVKVVPFYDRSDIIHETMDTLTEALTEEAIVVALIVLIFLLHVRSTLAILPTLPLSVLIAYIFMYWIGIDGNIMSLAGIAIAIGDVADMGIIMTENIYRRLGLEPDRPYQDVVYDAATEVGPAMFAAVSNTVISFLPVFLLTGPEGKLFQPLAYTKTFAYGASMVLAITLVPVIAYYTFKP
ncbi:MAG: efflux RND transporter permease subunit, partial [Planctomycetes bacterium]|nr:efflux RND transporter permease subunit [Planctomycetota bacterium]